MKLRIMKKKSDNNTVILSLAGALTIYTVSKLKEILMKELSAFSGLVMDLEGIDDADSAGLQLLLFLKREAESAGKVVMINRASARLNSILSLYNEKI